MIAPLFDALLADVRRLTAGAVPLPEKPWPDAGRGNLVLRGEMAYELGAGRLPAAGLFAATATDLLPQADGALLLGPDLPAIHTDGPWARVALVRLAPDAWQDEAALYDTLTRVRNARYSANPEGFMPRIDSKAEREPVRVSRAALARGLDFAAVAGHYRTAYRRTPQVVGVQQVFITDPGFDYAALAALAEQSRAILAALDHILKDFKMDCDSCSLQAVCNAVEGLRELHFKR